jgi:hypothetical protein
VNNAEDRFDLIRLFAPIRSLRSGFAGYMRFPRRTVPLATISALIRQMSGFQDDTIRKPLVSRDASTSSSIPASRFVTTAMRALGMGGGKRQAARSKKQKYFLQGALVGPLWITPASPRRSRSSQGQGL